ncbi:MAG: hypothetical protein N2246_00480 [Candidatus Sumerlaeia bacterium]|nr:hypothetical protein [Candidatus Sumerlaeia bacterium]
MITGWRNILSVIIVIFWLIMIFSLLNRYVFTDIPLPQDTTLVTPENLAEQKANYEEWMQLLAQETPIGIFHTGLKQLSQPFADYNRGDIDLLLRINPGGREQKFMLRATCLLDKQLQLQKLRLTATLDTINWEVIGTLHNKEFLYLLQRGSESFAGKIAITKPFTLLDSADKLIAQKFNLIPGESYRVPVFDPIWNFNAGEVIITVVGTEKVIVDEREEKVFKVITTLGNLRMTSWITADGKTMRRKIGNALEMLRITRQQATVIFPELREELPLPDIEPAEFLKRIAEQKRMEPLNALALISKLIGS